MKLEMFFIIISASPLLGQQTPRSYDPAEEDPSHIKWFLWEDETGHIRNESLTAPALRPRSGYGISDEKIKLCLCTPQNPDECEPIHPKNMGNRNFSKHFNQERINIFTIHGWKADSTSPVNTQIKTALLDGQGQGFNVFEVVWEKYAKQNYFFAKRYVNVIGSDLGTCLQSFVDTHELPPENIVLIGHSLGAHVAGQAGATMRTKPCCIIGLDPALPLFSIKDRNNRLDTTDAEYVKIIHTNGGLLGFASSIGHSDYYPNGGRKQPGCVNDFLGSCAHSRSVKYFAESLNSCKMNAVKCSNYDNFKAGKCNNNAKSDVGSFHPDQGNDVDFYFNTNDKAPFCQKI